MELRGGVDFSRYLELGHGEVLVVVETRGGRAFLVRQRETLAGIEHAQPISRDEAEQHYGEPVMRVLRSLDEG